MDVVSCAWSWAVILRAGALKHIMIGEIRRLPDILGIVVGESERPAAAQKLAAKRGQDAAAILEAARENERAG